MVAVIIGRECLVHYSLGAEFKAAKLLELVIAQVKAQKIILLLQQIWPQVYIMCWVLIQRRNYQLATVAPYV
jgi:hypothetical protein